MLLDDLDKKKLVQILGKLAEYCGVEVITCSMRLLFVTGGSANRSDKVVLDPALIKAELTRGGELGLGQVLRLRVRHFTDGVILGSRGFVNEMFIRHRDRFGPRRKDGARPIRGVPLPGMNVLRDLRVNAVG